MVRVWGGRVIGARVANAVIVGLGLSLPGARAMMCGLIFVEEGGS